MIISDGLYDRLKQHKSSARVADIESVPFDLADATWSLHREGTQRGAFRISLGDVVVSIGYRGRPNSPNVFVEFGAVSCATHSLEEMFALADELTGWLGEAESLLLQRIDLCADLTGLVLAVDDRNLFSTRSKGVAEYDDDTDASGGTTSYWKPTRNGPHLTGFAFSQGRDLSARVYDKTVELHRTPLDSEKRVVTTGLWSSAGWDGTSPVWRVEFQLRGQALKEFHLRSVLTVADGIDGAWQYGVRKWLRLTLPGRSRVSRAETCPRWLPLERVTFKHEHADPTARDRGASRGADDEQAFGSLLSNAGSRHRLEHLISEFGLPSMWSEKDMADRLTFVAGQAIENVLRHRGREYGLEAIERNVRKASTVWSAQAEKNPTSEEERSAVRARARSEVFGQGVVVVAVERNVHE